MAPRGSSTMAQQTCVMCEKEMKRTPSAIYCDYCAQRVNSKYKPEEKEIRFMDFVLRDITRQCNRLDLPAEARAKLIRRYMGADEAFEGIHIRDIAGALIVDYTRNNNIPVTMYEVGSLSSRGKQGLHFLRRAYKELVERGIVTKTATPTETYITYFVKKLNWPSELITTAKQINVEIREVPTLKHRVPKILAALCVYVAGLTHSNHPTKVGSFAKRTQMDRGHLNTVVNELEEFLKSKESENVSKPTNGRCEEKQANDEVQPKSRESDRTRQRGYRERAEELRATVCEWSAIGTREPCCNYEGA